MRLRELLDRSGVRFTGDALPDMDITAITDDSRQAGLGVLYCASRNGRRFVEQAAEVGSVLLLPPNLPAPSGSTVVRSASPDRAMAHLAAAFHGLPSQEMHVVAVTGTNGKTTTTHLLYHLWKKAGIPCALVGTLGLRYFDGASEATRETGFTTPRSYELQGMLRELLDKGIRHVTLEASSEALSLGRLEALSIHGVLFTGLGRDHLDHHRTLAAYMRAKRHLFFLARRCESVPFYVVYAEDEARRSLELFADRTNTSIRFLEEDDLSTESVVHQPVPTRFNRINAALAVHAALAIHGTTEQADFSDFAGVPGRMQLVPLSDKVDAFVDYAHSPDSLERILVEVRSIGYEQVIVVFGCGGDRDAGKRPLMGAIAAQLADFAIVTDDNPRTEDAASIRAQVLAGAADHVGHRMIEIGSRSAAIAASVEQARLLNRRVAVLVAGKGHETYQIIGREKTHFSDLEELQRISRSPLH